MTAVQVKPAANPIRPMDFAKRSTFACSTVISLLPMASRRAWPVTAARAAAAAVTADDDADAAADDVSKPG